jgi:hypothetical protein
LNYREKIKRKKGIGNYSLELGPHTIGDISRKTSPQQAASLTPNLAEPEHEGEYHGKNI